MYEGEVYTEREARVSTRLTGLDVLSLESRLRTTRGLRIFGLELTL